MLLTPGTSPLNPALALTGSGMGSWLIFLGLKAIIRAEIKTGPRSNFKIHHGLEAILIGLATVSVGLIFTIPTTKYLVNYLFSP